LKLILEHYSTTGKPYILNPTNTRYTELDAIALARANLILLRSKPSGVLFCQPTQVGLDQGAPPEEWLTYAEACARFFLKRRTLQKLVKDGIVAAKFQKRNGKRVCLLSAKSLLSYCSQ
jgi:hypothetical protein